MLVNNVLRGAVLVETAVVFVIYLWALAALLWRPSTKDPILRHMHVGRICRVSATLIAVGFGGAWVRSRWGHEVLTWHLIPYQLALLGYAGAWILLDRERYYAPREDETAHAAGRVLMKMADLELPPEDE